MKSNLIEEAAKVFHSVERWTAFCEIEKQIGNIMLEWMTLGAKALRRDFADHPSPCWKCSDWGSPRDTRWQLQDLGEQSIGIGIGWPSFELHLFHGGGDPHVRERALTLLELPTFEPLRSLTGSPEYRAEQKKYGCILSIRDFSPFDEEADSSLRQRMIAWQAGNQTPDFVVKVSARIRQVTENPDIVALIRNLNLQCLTQP